MKMKNNKNSKIIIITFCLILFYLDCYSSIFQFKFKFIFVPFIGLYNIKIRNVCMRVCYILNKIEHKKKK